MIDMQQSAERSETSSPLAERIRNLEKSLHFHRLLLVVLCVSSLSASAAAIFGIKQAFAAKRANMTLPDKIVAREFVLNDQEGRRRYLLRTGKDGELWQYFFDPRGTLRILTTVDGNHTANQMYDELGHSQIITAIRNNAAYFVIRDGTNDARIALHSTYNGPSFVSVYDSGGTNTHQLLSQRPHELH